MSDRTAIDVQPTVPPEALSWCIDGLSLRQWQNRGRVLVKAHRVTEATDRYGQAFHKPICGAPVPHVSIECVSPPVGWPACRHCSRKLVQAGVIPAVYFGGGLP
jgi:hypothetical protein